MTPYDQEHLLSSQAQQGRGKSRHSRSEKWISSKCGAASTLVETETEQDQQLLFCLVAFLVAFLIKESAVFMCVCTKLCKAYSSSVHGRKSERVKKSNQCHFIIVIVKSSRHIKCRSPQALQDSLQNCKEWRTALQNFALRKGLRIVWEHTVYIHTYSLNYALPQANFRVIKFYFKEIFIFNLFFKVRWSTDRWKS